MEILHIYLILIGIFSIIIGVSISLFFLFLSTSFFISEDIRKIFKNLSISMFFLFLYFTSFLLNLIFPDLQKNLVVIFLQTLFIFLSLSLLIYSSILLYNFAIELGFASPKNKRKIKKIIEKT